MDKISEISVANPMYKEDHEYSLQLNRWLMKPIGIWPRLSFTTRAEILVSKVTVVLCLCMITVVAIPCILNSLFEETDTQKKIKTAGPVSFWTMAIIKYSLLLFHGSDIRKCIEHIETDWKLVRNSRDRDIMLRNAKIGRFMTIICAIFMHCGVVCYTLVVSSSAITVPGNDTVTVKPLPYPFYNKILDTSFSPNYEIVLALQHISVHLVINSVTVGACSMAAALVSHACGQMQIVVEWLEHVITKEDHSINVIQGKLSTTVKQHLRAIRFIVYIENLMNQVCFVEIAGSAFPICLLGYYLVTEWGLEEANNIVYTYPLLIVSFICNIFIFCFLGELLLEQCERVGQTAYTIEWYRMPGKVACDLILLIACSGSLVRLTAGKMVNLSLVAFSGVIKSSIVYLNMLRTITAR